MSSIFFVYFIALFYGIVFIFSSLLGYVFYFVPKRDKMNYVQYLTTKKALTNCPSFPQAVFSSFCSPTGVTKKDGRDVGSKTTYFPAVNWRRCQSMQDIKS